MARSTYIEVECTFDDSGFHTKGAEVYKAALSGAEIQAKINQIHTACVSGVEHTLDGRPVEEMRDDGPGEGYRFLEVGEIMKAGDQYLDPALGWKTVGSDDCDLGEPFHSDYYPHRRKLQPSEPDQPRDHVVLERGYRPLNVGETIQKGDEFRCDREDEVWVKTACHGEEVLACDYGDYRRKTEGPVAEEGYRFLEDGERTQPGDQFYKDGSWWTAPDIAGAFREGLHHPYRRKLAPKVDPGEGYRLLEEGEKIQSGDEYLHLVTGWSRSFKEGIGFSEIEHRPIRRKLTPARVRCLCGHHDIESDKDPYRQHDIWAIIHDVEIPHPSKVTCLQEVKGIGVSAPQPVIGGPDLCGDDVARDLSSAELKALRAKGVR